MSFFDNIGDLAKAAQARAQESLKDALDRAKHARQERGGRAKEPVSNISETSGTAGIKTRLDMDDVEAQLAWGLAQQEMNAPLSCELGKMIQHIVGEDEAVIYKVQSSPDGERSQMVLTKPTLIVCAKRHIWWTDARHGRGISGSCASPRTSVHPHLPTENNHRL